jgi:hypothetical protein
LKDVYFDLRADGLELGEAEKMIASMLEEKNGI